jgi:hypothetical protein
VRFRNALREVLITAETVEYGRLLDKQEDLEPTESKADLERMGELSDRQSRLNRAWKNSICTCSICGSRTSDMTYNIFLSKWFSVDCYKKSQEFYKKKRSEGEIWYDESVNRVPSYKWWP